MAGGDVPQRTEHGVLIGDVHLQRVGAGGADPLEGGRGLGCPDDRPVVGEQPLDDRVAEVAGADDERDGH